jgi:DNA-binding transcriptional ArsR family regulator
VTDAFRALADPTRRAILDLLRTGSRTSGEIAEQFGSSWPTISRHLSVLRDAGLINAEKEGQFMRYELATTVFQDVLKVLAAWAQSSDKESAQGAQ